MRRTLGSSHALDAGFMAGTIVLALLGCSKNPTRPVVRAVESPTAVVERFRKAWIQRDTLALRSCLAQAFVYASACVDSTGAAYFAIGPHRDSTLLAVARLFRRGSATHPPAISIDVRIDSMEVYLAPEDTIRERDALGTASVVIQTPSETLNLGGFTGFHLVRGDIALAPTDPPDSTRWFIQHWIEVVMHETPPASAARARAAWRARQLMTQGFRAGFHAAPQAPAADSTECDSLERTMWGYAVRRYLD